MQITHEEARAWVHLSLDGSLHPTQKQQLDMHLAACAECRRYADSIATMESMLRPLLKRQWNQQPLPLPIGSLIPRNNGKNVDSMLLATRIVAVGVMFITFMFSAWHFSLSGSPVPGPAQAYVPSMPIPSTSTQWQSTDTGRSESECVYMSYIVGKNDTLAGIANQFSVSMDQIIQSNALINNTMVTGQEIVIPICRSTPTTTVDAQTSTLTPVMGRSTSTPGG